MKLSEHNLLSQRCAMTELGYQWKRDQCDRSLRWLDVDHWELWPWRCILLLSAVVT